MGLSIVLVAGGAVGWYRWHDRSVRNASVKAVLAQAQQAARDSNLPEARRILAAAVQKDSQSADLHAALAAIELRSSPAKALDDAREALRLNPRHAGALDVISAVHTAQRLRAISSAQMNVSLVAEIKDYNDILARDGDAPQALYRAASHQLQLFALDPQNTGALETGCRQAERLVQITKGSAPASNRAAAQSLLGACALKRAAAANRASKGAETTANLEKAAAAYRKALDIAPESVDAATELSATLRALGQMDQASTEILERANRASTASARAGMLSVLGVALSAQARLDQAMAACDQAIAADAKQPVGYLCASAVDQKRGDPDAAEKALLKAVEQTPAFVAGWLALENLYEARGSRKDAIRTLETVLQIQPQAAVFQTALTPAPPSLNEVYFRTAIRLSRLYLDSGDAQAARQTAARAAQFGGPAPEVREIIGRVSFQEKKYTEAAAALAPIMQHNPSPETRFLLAQAYSASGRPLLARDQLNQVLSDRNITFRAEAEKLLAHVSR